MPGSKTSKKTTTRKTSAKQTAARTKFKKMIIEAKKIKKENPTMKWTECIKSAAKK